MSLTVSGCLGPSCLFSSQPAHLSVRVFSARRPVVIRLLLRTVSALVLAVGVGMIGAAQEARGQDEMGPCEDTLEVASRAYQNRNFQKAIRLASQCTDWEAVSKATAIQAYRRQGLAFLRQGALVQARSAVAHILEIDSTYTADPVADPPSYSLLVSMVRQRRGGGGTESTAEARQPKGLEKTFFAKFGIGFSDYTGDLPIQNTGHPLDFQEFSSGSGFPFMLNGELGYHFNPRWALSLGFQSGNYPIVGYSTGGGISDSWRYTAQLLARYTFGTLTESASLYLDGGVNATFGGNGSAGFGPSVGAGVDVPLSDAVSFYIESRFNFTLPDDAIDGTADIGDRPGSSTTKTDDPQGSVTGSFDSVNQLLGVGLKVSLGGGSRASRE